MSTTKELPETTSTVGTEIPIQAASLPDMDSAADVDTVIYDGHCNFCKAQVQRLAWLAGDRLTFVSLHDKRVPERFPELTHDQLMQEMYVITPDRKQYGGAAAVRYLTRRLPKLWIVAPLMHIPFSMPVWKWLYRQVARTRYRIAGSCENDSCKIHLDK